MNDRNRLLTEAERFITACCEELGKNEADKDARLAAVRQAIAERGHYEHTAEELQHGAKMAWRNSNRCIGRLFWDSLNVVDARHLETAAEIAHAAFRHLDFATNGGKIRPTITIFKPAVQPGQEIRIANHQLIRYAGYRTEQGIVGDPASVALTAWCRQLGWKGAGGRFDVLPLVIQVGSEPPAWFDLPKSVVTEVPITHPELPGFESFRLQWYAVPAVSDMRLEIGGISYTAAPFNGWYMGTEIGARNFADENRYDMLPKVAALMGLDTSREATLWRDKALVELNVAVLHSYKQHGVMIVDHHTAAQQFQRFENREQQNGRPLTGDWSWLIPPMSPATTSIFHRHYDNRMETPNFFYQDKLYRDPESDEGQKKEASGCKRMPQQI